MTFLLQAGLILCLHTPYTSQQGIWFQGAVKVWVNLAAPSHPMQQGRDPSRVPRCHCRCCCQSHSFLPRWHCRYSLMDIPTAKEWHGAAALGRGSAASQPLQFPCGIFRSLWTLEFKMCQKQSGSTEHLSACCLTCWSGSVDKTSMTVFNQI